MFDVSYTPKVLHVAINRVMERSVFKGIIYDPRAVLSQKDESARRHYDEFFLSKAEYQIICLDTEMVPGELVKIFEQEFECRNFVIIGGMIAPFTITGLGLVNIRRELIAHPKNYLHSKEKEKIVQS
jgi:hypothetical protein